MERIPRRVGVVADAGFDGLHHDLPEHSVATPHQARRNHPLKEDQKSANQELARVRIVV
ncbi:MAG TPA: transposase family protein [Caldilineae bacterium]|nr:transposase family protein [Caldilineae bacterium]